MANSWRPRVTVQFQVNGNGQQKLRSRPFPLRMRTFSDSGPWSPVAGEIREGSHIRHKSTSTAADDSDLSPKSRRMHEHAIEISTEPNSPTASFDDSASDVTALSSSPATPLTSLASARNSLEMSIPGPLAFDYSRMDYELEQATFIGKGLWSNVYLAEQKATQCIVSSESPPSPLRFRRQPRSGSALFAIKTPARKDSGPIFGQEAKVLAHLQGRSISSQFIVAFYGLDDRNGSLVFEALIGGSLEGLNDRLKQMTEVARHLELIAIFPGIAIDLVNGLEFLHASGVVHADIKPGNVLLDISEHATESKPVIRARYIDFSAAFIPGAGDSESNAGGTWDYMAPEQMRIQKDLNTPTFASDVWSLGITLLCMLVGDSPYAAACGGNNFMLREAIKSADPIGFAKMDPVPRKRLAACQDFVDCCRLALKKERGNRTTAAAWSSWLDDWQLDG
ncbi:uncharacterized protein RCC_06909 [Ramularia collo-cygni]|uniref:non-specific serine/threonine protein kinase n=1 Tax=Ramularia collo-cygni TaxID=112498 RepID=A0A2D3UZV4_9PEZI|nr:uncharacterized protein RCC_06909 [Ramularia collo-cygni]CZT21048.1 uncharacterized protein RCC_06909 [Ramularia collo-cygni]